VLELMTDNRFKNFPVDARFPTPGTDVRHQTPGVDGRFQGGVDTRFQGNDYGQIASFSVTLTGLSTDSIGLYGRVGGHASIGFTTTPVITPDEVKWSASASTGAAATFGTGANPTDFTAADGFLVYLHVRRNTEWVTRSFTARRLPATGGADLDLSFPEDIAITSTNLIANWTANGNTLTFFSVSPPLPAGLSINSAGAMTGTPTTPTADATYTLTMRDAYLRSVSDTFTLQITANIAVNPVISSSAFADDGNAPDTMTTGGTYAGADIIDGTLQFRQGTTLRATFTQLGLTVTGGNFAFDVLIQNSNLVYEPGSTAADMPNVDNIRVTVFERTNGGTATVDVTGVSGIDMTAPTFNAAGSTPADGATGVALTGNLVAVFTENVFAGTGLFTLRNVTGGADVETFNVATGLGSAGGTISISGLNVTLSPGAARLASTAYAGRWAAGALVDQDGNPIAANTGDTLWNWTTGAGAVISTPTLANTAHPNANIDTVTNWTSGSNLFPAAGTYLVTTVLNSGSGGFTSIVGGSNIASTQLLGMSSSNNDSLCLHLVTTSAASTISLLTTAGTAFAYGVVIHTLAGATATGRQVEVLTGNSGNPFSTAMTGIAANRWMVTAFYTEQGTTSAYALGGGFVSGDIISARGVGGGVNSPWSSGDLIGLAFKQISGTSFTSQVTLTDDGTRFNRMVSAALAAV
jgi:heptaprenylglyceryl phosphate synthase